MLAVASERGIAPDCVLFDSWYSSLVNIRGIRDLGWDFLKRHCSSDAAITYGVGLTAS